MSFSFYKYKAEEERGSGEYPPEGFTEIRPQLVYHSTNIKYFCIEDDCHSPTLNNRDV